MTISVLRSNFPLNLQTNWERKVEVEVTILIVISHYIPQFECTFLMAQRLQAQREEALLGFFHFDMGGVN